MALTDNILAYWNLNDDGSGGVSLADSTGNGNTLTNNNGVTLGTGIIAGDAVFSGGQSLSTANTLIPPPSGAFSVSLWTNSDVNSGVLISSATSGANSFLMQNYASTTYVQVLSNGSLIAQFNALPIANTWTHYAFTYDSAGNGVFYQNGTPVDSKNAAGIGTDPSGGFVMGARWDGYSLVGQLDEVGIWSRALSGYEVTALYNSGSGVTYPFQSVTTPQYYNNNQEDGDWGNILNWWIDSGFTIQSSFLPTSSTPVNLYNQVTQNTQGANQCFCASANFWSADFAYGLTLQSTGVVNMQGSSVMAGHTTDGVSMHDSSTLADTSVIDADVTMRDSSRAFGYIGGNAYVYYDTGNGQFPIGGTVAGSVSYLGWPAVTPQWFNDKVTGGGNDGDFSNKANWWTSNTYSVRPINAEGTQELPDASTDVFIAPNTGIVANSGTANPTINSVTANDSNIQNISITTTNGFLFSGNEGVANAVLYGNVIFQDTAYNDHAVIQGKATYKSAASLQYSWGQNSLGNVNAGMYNGSTAFEVNISGGGAGNGGFISRLLHLPWFINI